MISLQGAGIRYGSRWIFRSLDIHVAVGKTLAVLGPNGRGKTSLLRSLTGMQLLSEGRCVLPSLMGYVPQSPSNPLAEFSVLEMVVMGLSRRIGVFGRPKAADYERAKWALGEAGISSLATRRFDTLSGGERQLVMLARAIAPGANTIVLDEPTSALDPANQAKVLEILRRLKATGNYALIFTTHSPQQALFVADETLLMMPEGSVLLGRSDDVLSERNLSELYQVPIRRISAGPGPDAFVPVLGLQSSDRARSDPHILRGDVQ